MLLAVSEILVLWICLSIFLIIVGLALSVMLWRLGSTAQRLTSLLGGVEEKALPLIEEVNGTVERMNEQLDKADVVTTSAVDAVSAVDRSVRMVAGAVSWPVRKLSSFTTGVRYGSASLRTEQDVTRAYEAGRAAAKRRAADIEEELSESESTDEKAPEEGGAGAGAAWMRAPATPTPADATADEDADVGAEPSTKPTYRSVPRDRDSGDLER